MKKTVIILVILLVSIFIGGITVHASSKGICMDAAEMKPEWGGYCKINPGITISETSFGSDGHLWYTNGKSASGMRYMGTYKGKTQDLICIDANIQAPTGMTYNYARPIDIEMSKYDLAFGKVYSDYINWAIWAYNNVAGKTKEQAFRDYLQVVNVVARALTVKYGYYNEVPGSPFAERLEWYQNIVKQFEGDASAPNVKLRTNDVDMQWFKLAQKAYCGALLTAGDKPSGNCSSVEGVTTNRPRIYEVKIPPVDPSTIVDEGNTTDFKKIIPIKIQGINVFTSQLGFGDEDVYVMITKVTCPDTPKVKCELQDPSLLNKDLLDWNNRSATEREVNIVVSGKLSDFPAGVTVKPNVEVKYHHILDVSKVAVLRYSPTNAEQIWQRMMMFFPGLPFTTKLEVNITVAGACKKEYNSVTNEWVYYYGDEKTPNTIVSPREYVEKCCDTDDSLEYSQLPPGTMTIDEYRDYCPEGPKDGYDIVYLEENCRNGAAGYTCTNDPRPSSSEYSHSYAYQQGIDGVMVRIKNEELTLKNTGFSPTGVSAHRTNINEYSIKNYRDDLYLYNDFVGSGTLPIESNNYYCKLYTSEQTDVFLPGTVETSSGRFFTFEKQPYITGDINANFHTNLEWWLNDYKKAIEEEWVAYTNWQIALARDNAITRLRPCTSYRCSGSNCSPCSCLVPPCGSCCNCSSCSSTGYTGTNSASPVSGTYANAQGTDLASHPETQVTRTCVACYGASCGGCSDGYIIEPTAYDTANRKDIYDQKVAWRETLERYKTQCEGKSNIHANWRYFFEPDMTFSYRQYYYDVTTRKNMEITENLPMQVVKPGDPPERYWPNVSTLPIELTGSRSGVRVPKAMSTVSNPSGSGRTSTYGGNYGGGSYLKNIPYVYDETKDYRIGYTQKIYYKPIQRWFTLLPDGKYVTNQTTTQVNSRLEIGYVYNITITNYQGDYETWFSTNYIGHLMKPVTQTPKDSPGSNIQRVIEKYLEKNPNKKVSSRDNGDYLSDLNINPSLQFVSKCNYCNKEIFVRPDCPKCCIMVYDPVTKESVLRDPETGQICGANPDDWTPFFFWRPIALNELNPQPRDLGINWVDAKGESARSRISSIGDGIYNDATGEYLEYEFTIGPNEMGQIRRDYNATGMAGRTYNDFALTCNEYGKECRSPLVTAYASNTSGRSKWKYYVDGNWRIGTILSVLGDYPEENDQSYSGRNWP